MTRIHFWTADEGGCAYYRAKQPGAVLAEQGHDVTVGQALPAANMRDGVVVGARVHLPGPLSLWRGMSESDAVTTVFEVDDDLWHMPPDNPAHWWYGRPEIATVLAESIGVANRVVVSTAPLARVVAEFTDAPVTVVPNFIPAWTLRSDSYLRQGDTTNLHLGWGGSRHHVDDWNDGWVRALNRWMTAPVNAGHQDTLSVFGGKAYGLESATVTDWIDDTEDYLRALDFDVSVIPLARTTFNESKSWIKALECMALGIVPVAANVGPYASFVRHGVDGILLDDPVHLPTVLRRLRDPEIRLNVVTNGIQTARRNTIEGNIGLWQAALGLGVPSCATT